MNLFKKLFGNNKQNSNNSSQNTSAKTAQLKAMIEPLIINATKINCEKASRPPEDSGLLSHFGGQPYFETGEQWPKSKAGNPLGFVFQVFNEAGTQLPENIKLVQFYYDPESNAWDTEDDGWLVKIYEQLDTANIETVAKPAELEKTKFCQITFQSIKSLPDWEGLDLHCPAASDLSAEINDDEPWEAYNLLAEKLTGNDVDDSLTQLGGYPKWVQGETTYEDSNGNSLPLLFQIDSEENADIMWGDAGMVYVFYDPKTKKVEFELQCY